MDYWKNTIPDMYILGCGSYHLGFHISHFVSDFLKVTIPEIFHSKKEQQRHYKKQMHALTCTMYSN